MKPARPKAWASSAGRNQGLAAKSARRDGSSRASSAQLKAKKLREFVDNENKIDVRPPLLSAETLRECIEHGMNHFERTGERPPMLEKVNKA